MEEPSKQDKSFINNIRIGSKAAHWKGGRFVSDGYVYVYKPDHPHADKAHYIEEHRVVWEEYHNACLLRSSIVHHINGIRDDNRIENLQGMTRSQHAIHHHTDPEMSKRVCGICGGKTTTTIRNFKTYDTWHLLGDIKICCRCNSRRYRQLKREALI